MKMIKTKHIFLFILILAVNAAINASDSWKRDETGNNFLLSASVVPLETRQVLSPEHPSTNSESKVGSIYKDIFDHSPDLIAILTNYTFEPLTSNSITRINKKAWRRTLGFEEKDVIGSSLQSFIHPEDVQDSIDCMIKFNHNISDQIPFEFNSRYRCKNNSYCWIQWAILRPSDLHLEEKERINVLCIGKDITSQKEKDQILKAVFEIQSAYISEKEMSEKYSAKGEEIDYFTECYNPLKIIINNFIKVTESEFGFCGELFYDEQSKPYIRQVFSGMGDKTIKQIGMYLKDKEKKEGKKLSCFNNVLGEIINRKNSLIINDVKSYGKPTGIPRIHLSISSLLGFPLIVRDKIIGIVCLANRKQGYNEDIFSSLEPLSILSGRIMNELKMERREIDYQMAARQSAEAANETKSAFLAHMSHELRTPLTGLLGMLELVRDENVMEEDLHYLEAARESGKILLSIINDILDISKIEAGELKFESIRFSPVTIVQEVVHILGTEANKKGINLDLKISPKIPPHLVGDPTRLKQIFFNLIGNAVKFTPKGSVSVILDGLLGDQKNQFWLMGDVIDTGIGISSEVQGQLFKPFIQADNQMQRKFGGTGLGLYITGKLCEMMKGEISVSSEIGKGSKFHFKVELEQPQEPSSIEFRGGMPIDILPSIRVLVVEDNSVCQLVLKTMLTRAQCSVTTVWNGEEAINACQSGHYDIVLMDGEMPVMDGVTATRKIRETFNRETLPIIGVTAHAMLTEKDKFLEAGMNGYLTKPIERKLLFNEIMNCLPEKLAGPQS